MIQRRKSIIVLFICFLAGIGASAKGPAISDQLLRADLGVEHTRGANNAAAGLGNGRLTVGISPWSELVYFRWPTVSGHEQLRYVTKGYGPLRDHSKKFDVRYGEDAPSADWRRYGRPYEPYPGMGARGGLLFDSGELAWLGDPSWTSTRAYEPDWSPVLCTSLSRTEKTPAGINACQWVDWNEDLFIQEFTLSSPAAKKFFYYATFDPNYKYSNYSGNPDIKDAGFAAVYLSDQSIILYFQPLNKDRTKLQKHLGGKFSAELIDSLYPAGGRFIALGFDGNADGFQVGADFRGNKVQKDAPPAASAQAKSGSLSGSAYFIGQADAGLEKKISGDGQQIVVLTSVAESARGAVSIIEKARASGIEKLRSRGQADWQPLAARINLPESASPAQMRVARRSILNLFVGRDKKTGAIIASPSRQPAYHFDWPRDGAFFDLTLDFAGFPDLVSSHLDFYLRTQRKENLGFGLLLMRRGGSPFYSPRGHWHPHMYSDGSRGRIRQIPFEIDETALVAWDLWRHEQFVAQADKEKYQKQNLETLTLAADALVDYVDLKKGWTRKAMEDDHDTPQATLHGAASVLAGLASAVDAGPRWGADPGKIETWRRAAIALREGILVRINDDKMLEQGGWRGLQWSLFPAPVFDSYDDPRAQKLLARLATEIEEKVDKKRPGFAYLGEQVFILGIAAASRPEYQPLVRRAVDLLVNEVPFPGSDCYGEVTVWMEVPGLPGKVSEQRTAMPHLWTGVTTYLAVESLYRPERFLSQIPPLPK